MKLEIICLDQELKLALTKMLPDKIYISGVTAQVPRWEGCGSIVQDTEWLHVCWLVEQKLDIIELTNYGTELNRMTFAGEANDPIICHQCSFHKSWQQRAIALCRVKGIEI